MIERKIDYLRQLDILSPEQMENVQVNLCGCGGIGSITGLLLAKMGIPSINIYDPDTIEPHNAPNQILPPYPGIFKVDGFKGVMDIFIDGKQRINYGKTTITRKTAANLIGMVIFALDSMKARKEIFSGIKFRPSVPLLIDGRMGGETGRIYTIRPSIVEEVDIYEKSLYSDDDTPADGACTARAIIYNTAFIGSIICSQIKKFLTGEKYPKSILFNLKYYRIIQDVQE